MMGCGANTRQVEVLLDAMSMMKTLYEKASKMPVDGDAETVPCAFDANCPIAGCPFRLSEPPPPPPPPDKSTGDDGHWASTDTGHRAAPSGKAPKTAVGYTRPQPPVDKSIEDDADLFVVGVGREDPCRFREPVPRLAGTQYLYSDISASFLPAPEPEPEPVPVPEPKKKSKKAKKGKKGKADVKKKK